MCMLQANAEKVDDEMADELTMENVQTEAAAKQRAFESHQTKASTSGRGAETGELQFPEDISYSCAKMPL